MSNKADMSLEKQPKAETPKQREIRLRKTRILDVAERLFAELGYHELSMRHVADALDCSPATIYQHYSCKEEVLLAQGLRRIDERRSWFARAATFQGRPRERLLAIGVADELYIQLYPDAVRLLETVKTEFVMARVSQKLRMMVQLNDVRFVRIVLGIIRDAIAGRDLTLPDGVTPEGMAYGFWVLQAGGCGPILGSLYVSDVGLNDLFAVVKRNHHVLGDGYAWRPLYSEWDYAATEKRIREEIFPEEQARVFVESRKRRKTNRRESSPDDRLMMTLSLL